jgi:hypothetical protein
VVAAGGAAGAVDGVFGAGALPGETAGDGAAGLEGVSIDIGRS